MNKMKEITTELVNERLEKLGFGETAANDSDVAMRNVLNHYNVKLSDNFNKADFYIYEESTADGYEVYVATYDISKVNICADVYYYDSDLAQILIDNIKHCDRREDFPHIIYISDLDSNFVEEAMVDLFDYLTDRLEEEVRDELFDEGYEVSTSDLGAVLDYAYTNLKPEQL